MKEKAIKTNIQDKSQETLNVSSLSIFFQDLHGFLKKAEQNGNIQWVTVNG